VASKIGGFDNQPVSVGTGSSVKRSPDSAAGGTESSGAQADPVQITGSARQLATLEQHLKTLPAIDQSRVAKIQDALATGRYQINAGRVADKMLGLEHQLNDKVGTEK
jgi:negative regulator of flagellin synthesis FlgM